MVPEEFPGILWYRMDWAPRVRTPAASPVWFASFATIALRTTRQCPQDNSAPSPGSKRRTSVLVESAWTLGSMLELQEYGNFRYSLAGRV